MKLTKPKKPITKLARQLKMQRQLKLDPSIRRTISLLLFMLLVGLVFGTVGFVFARQSLKGVTQPATNPFLNENDADDLNRRPRQGADFLSEKDLIAKAKSITNGANASKPQNQKTPKSDKAKPKPSTSKKDAPSKTQSFPIKVQDQGMNFEVKSLSQEDDTLILNVALQNASDNKIQFVYTFLDITDDQGQALFSEIRGLPTEFKPKGETFIGTIKILDVPTDRIEKISLSLNDYPDQKVKLEVQNIPVSD